MEFLKGLVWGFLFSALAWTVLVVSVVQLYWLF